MYMYIKECGCGCIGGFVWCFILLIYDVGIGMGILISIYKWVYVSGYAVGY